jgi:hypothetical protein
MRSRLAGRTTDNKTGGEWFGSDAVVRTISAT